MLAGQARGWQAEPTWPPLKHGRGDRLLAQAPATAAPADVASTVRASDTCGLPLMAGRPGWALGALKGLCSRQVTACHYSSLDLSAVKGEVDVEQGKFRLMWLS